MAIRIRDKTQKPVDAGVSRKDDRNGQSQPTKETNKDAPIPDVRSFREQAILVINTLESEGIDLYDKARTPGMYLKRRGTAMVPDQLIQKILSGNDDQASTLNAKQPTSTGNNSEAKAGGEQLPPGLVAFLTKNKKP
jgi:hypothetical protein